MEPITGLTRGGTPWTPAFVMDLNEAHCIGCGRCYKVCPRNCFELVELEDEDEDDADEAGMVMRLADPMDCIGCGACARVCPKQCHTHAPADLAC